MKPLIQHAVDITSAHWDAQETLARHQAKELEHFKVLYNAGLTSQIPRTADGKSMMELIDEDICGYCGRTKKRGEWCNNSRCDSQLRRKRA